MPTTLAVRRLDKTILFRHCVALKTTNRRIIGYSFYARPPSESWWRQLVNRSRAYLQRRSCDAHSHQLGLSRGDSGLVDSDEHGAGPAPANEKNDILSMMPDNALAFVVVNDPALSVKKVSALAERIEVPLPDLMDLLKGRLPAVEHVDMSRPAAACHLSRRQWSFRIDAGPGHGLYCICQSWWCAGHVRGSGQSEFCRGPGGCHFLQRVRPVD